MYILDMPSVSKSVPQKTRVSCANNHNRLRHHRWPHRWRNFTSLLESGGTWVPATIYTRESVAKRRIGAIGAPLPSLVVNFRKGWMINQD